jgi:hypothetical protein
MIEQDREGLGRLRAALDWSVQQTCASWVVKHSEQKLRDLHPNVLAGDFRQSAYLYYRDSYPDPDMRIVGGPNCSVAVLGPSGRRTSIRKHPRILSTGFLLPPTAYPSNTLFGDDYEIVAWKPYILWEADLDRQVLQDAWLAAIAEINKPSKTAIFDRVPLPPAILPPVSLDNPTPEDPEAGNWPEWPKEGSGKAPA